MEGRKGRNRTGSLYRRWKGEKFNVEDPAAFDKGTIYLKYSVDGKRIEVNLKTADIEEAKRKQVQTMRPLELSDTAEAIAQTELRLRQVRGQEQEEWKRSNPPLKLDDAWDAYLRAHNRTQPGPSTLSGYAADFRLFREWVGEAFPRAVFMRDIGVREAEAYAENLNARHLSPGSYNHHLNTLSMIWSILSERAQTDRNPFAWDRKTRRGIARKSVRAEAYVRKRRPLSVEEVNRILDHADGDYRTLICILVFTGQRLIDGVKLEWSSIDFDRHTIRIIPQKTATRTGKPVIIPLMPQLEQELLKRERTGRYVLPEVVAQCQRYRPFAQKKIKSIIKMAGIETAKKTELKTHRAIADVGAHSFRHTFVTLARAAGLPDPMIIQIAGHGSREMVDHYAQFSEEMVSSLAGRLLGTAAEGGKRLPEPSIKAQGPLRERLQRMREAVQTITGKKNEAAKAMLLSELSELV